MKIEILLATMFFEKENDDFLDKMNIETDIIIGDQCNVTLDKEFKHGENTVRVLSRSERGVGKNRNAALDASSADIIILADNDIRYYSGYSKKIEKFYRSHPDADMVIFNYKEKRGDEPLHDINTLDKKAALHDITKFGAWAITARRESLKENNLRFSLLFGGGAKYSCGEDTLFLTECYNKGLNIYLSSETLGEVIHRESTWFNGVTDKYVFDKGVLFKAMCPKLTLLFIARHAIKHRKTYESYGSVIKVIKRMLQGAKEYSNLSK